MDPNLDRPLETAPTSGSSVVRPSPEGLLVTHIVDGTRGNLDMRTLRDQFAMAALSGLIKRHRADVAWGEIAPTAYKIADAMMEARKK